MIITCYCCVFRKRKIRFSSQQDYKLLSRNLSILYERKYLDASVSLHFTSFILHLIHSNDTALIVGSAFDARGLQGAAAPKPLDDEDVEVELARLGRELGGNSIDLGQF